MKKHSQTSAVWNYFEKLKENGAMCLLCQNRVSCFSNTSNLVKHLRRRHPEVLVDGVLQPRRLKHVDSDDYEDYESEGVQEEDAAGATAETNAAVHTIQAYRDVNGTTFLYLQPHADGDQSVPIQNAQFQPVVANSDSITSNGEIVSVAVQKDAEGQVVDGEAKTHEEATPRKLVHAPIKSFQGSSVAGRTVVRQFARPNPIAATSHATNSTSNNNNKEDSFEAFGKYIASMLRNLPTKNAWKLQGEIVNWILKEQIKNTGC